MNFDQFTIKSQEAIQKAQELATQNQNSQIENILLLKGILDSEENLVPYIFQKLEVDINRISQTTEAAISSLPKVSSGQQIYLSQSANKTLLQAKKHLKDFGDSYVSVEHLLLSLLQSGDQASRISKKCRNNRKNIKTKH